MSVFETFQAKKYSQIKKLKISRHKSIFNFTQIIIIAFFRMVKIILNKLENCKKIRAQKHIKI